MAYFSVAGEGILDVAVARKILQKTDHTVFAEYDKRGKNKIDASLPGFLNASRHSKWLVLRDLDNILCAPTLIETIAPNLAEFPNLALRICVRSIEAWLLADRIAFSRYFGISSAQVSMDPDALVDPKSTLVKHVERSRFRNLREGVVPRPGSGRKVGPEYNDVLSEYIANTWDIDRASQASNSLARAVRHLRAM